MVTVTTRFRRRKKGGDAMVQFDCTMHGLCGSPIWDPCPMYLAYMERQGQPEAEEKPPAATCSEAW
jgi:hypothetical protein